MSLTTKVVYTITMLLCGKFILILWLIYCFFLFTNTILVYIKFLLYKEIHTENNLELLIFYVLSKITKKKNYFEIVSYLCFRMIFNYLIFNIRLLILSTKIIVTLTDTIKYTNIMNKKWLYKKFIKKAIIEIRKDLPWNYNNNIPHTFEVKLFRRVVKVTKKQKVW